MSYKISMARRNAALDALGARLNSGYLRIYDGSRPADPDVAISGQVLLAELRFGATAFGAAGSGSMAANAITQDSLADATGTATWFRTLESDGSTPVLDGNVGTGGSDLNLNSAAITAGGIVAVTGFTITHP